MAVSKLIVTPTQRIQQERFTKPDDFKLLDLSLSLSGKIAVCGRCISTGRPFIDLYFGRNSDQGNKLTLLHSKEFEQYSDHGYISFLENSSQLVSCIDDKIQVIDLKNDREVLPPCRVNDKIRCVAVREGEIFIGLAASQTVLVFNYDLKETKRIILKEITSGDWPRDLQVIKDTIFVCTGHLKVYAINERTGSVITQYTNTTGEYVGAYTIAVSESLGLVFVAWSGRRIIAYSLNENNCFLVFDDHSDVHRIRISDRDRTMITGDKRTGEMKIYDLDQMFTFETMKRTLASIVTSEECEELRKYFGVTEEEMSQRWIVDEESGEMDEEEETIKRMESLLSIIEDKGHLDSYNINNLKDAVTAIGDEMRVSNLQRPMEGYVLYGLKSQDLVAEMATIQKAWKDDKTQLSDALNTAKESEKTIHALEDELLKMKKQHQEQEQKLRSQFEQSKQSVDSIRAECDEKGLLIAELEQTKSESADTIEALTEELRQIKQSLDLTTAESADKMKLLNEELEQTKAASTKRIKTLTKELTQTKQSLDLTTAESADKMKLLNEELEQTKTVSTKTIETLTKELTQTKQSLDLTTAESADKMKLLNEELEQTKAASNKAMETLTGELKQTKLKLNSNIKEKDTLLEALANTMQVLDETKQDRDSTRSELERYQLEFAKESKVLKEDLTQTKEAVSELQKGAMENKPLDERKRGRTTREQRSEKTRGVDTSILGTEFGMLVVSVAEYLTLDDCVQLGTLFNLSPADCDTVLRVSFIQWPGKKFLDILKQRGFINEFDVTNLQKALAMLELKAVNQNVVVPYQEKVDKEHYEKCKVDELITWDAVNAYLSRVKDDKVTCQMKDSQMHHEDDTETDNTAQGETKASHLERGVEDRASHLRDIRHQFYTECSIGREGGTIQFANVSLTIPPDALHESHVIALTVMNESPFSLDRQVNTARMTPVIKLEPLGLIVKKSLQLSIPHSALIPQPENHDVIIYVGQNSKSAEDSLDCMQWTVDTSFPRQLKEKSVTIDIQCLSYFSASLVNQTVTPMLYIVRAVTFVDVIRNADDDVTLTLCFCSDNDADYNILLLDYKTKLALEQYSTLQLQRHSGSDEDDAGFLSVTVKSVNGTYALNADHTVKKFLVSHLCAASRVSHQFRLTKNQDTARDVLDVVLTFTQAPYEPIIISLKARIKDLIMSEESEKRLADPNPKVEEAYDDLVDNITSSLDAEQCGELASHFQLTSQETEMITSNQDPGKMLVKTLEERSVIDSQKMILFFEALRICNLDETAELVSGYISNISKQTAQESKLEANAKTLEPQEDTSFSQHLSKKRLIQRSSSVIDQEVQTTLSNSSVISDEHIKTLTDEGYAVQEVLKALDISKNRPTVARGVLNYIGEGRDLLTETDLCLYKEQYVDENGGKILLREANIRMHIPAGALSSRTAVSMMITNGNTFPSEEGAIHLTPILKCGPEGLTLKKPGTILIPHCAAETEGITSTGMYFGFASSESEIQWRKREQHEPAPVLKEDHFEVSLTEFCTVALNNTVDNKKPLAKKLRILALFGRVTNPSDDLSVTVWIYNDDEAEHMHLLHDEISVGSNVQVHHYQRLVLKGFEQEKEIRIRSGNNNIKSRFDKKKIICTTLWCNRRHSVEFHFYNKESIHDISFKLTIGDLHFDLKVTLDELLPGTSGIY